MVKSLTVRLSSVALAVVLAPKICAGNQPTQGNAGPKITHTGADSMHLDLIRHINPSDTFQSPEHKKMFEAMERAVDAEKKKQLLSLS